LIEKCYPIIRGWLGHKAPFDFNNTFEKSASIEMMRVGTPPVIQMSILEKSLDIFRDLDFHKLRKESIKLSDLFINMVERTCSDLHLESPLKSSERGSQVSFSHPSGYAIMQALIDRNIVGDFRAPNIIRFGITPLYISQEDIIRTVEVLRDILSNRLWDTPAYLNRKKVT
jgi:kynureninase